MKNSYDEDRVLTAYIRHNYLHLFTQFERKVDFRFIVEMKSKRLSPEDRAARVALMCGPPDRAVDSTLEQGHLAFLDRVRARVLAEASDQIVIMRCPMCLRIVRTPKARQCMWCHHDWHAATRES
jgi:hypothetical protein